MLSNKYMLQLHLTVKNNYLLTLLQFLHRVSKNTTQVMAIVQNLGQCSSTTDQINNNLAHLDHKYSYYNSFELAELEV